MKRKIHHLKGSHGINRLKRFFPQVETVSDSTKRVEVNVTEQDCSGAKKGNIQACALARACKRALKMDGVIIGLSTSYLIKGTHATRYRTPPTVAREIVTFDRHHDFDIGRYHLSRISLSQGFDRARAREKKRNHNGKGKRKGPVSHIIHTTARVRSLRPHVKA